MPPLRNTPHSQPLRHYVRRLSLNQFVNDIRNYLIVFIIFLTAFSRRFFYGFLSNFFFELIALFFLFFSLTFFFIFSTAPDEKK